MNNIGVHLWKMKLNKLLHNSTGNNKISSFYIQHGSETSWFFLFIYSCILYGKNYFYAK